jgi:hypothetical protein
MDNMIYMQLQQIRALGLVVVHNTMSIDRACGIESDFGSDYLASRRFHPLSSSTEQGKIDV